MEITGSEIKVQGVDTLGYFIRLECPFEVSEQLIETIR